MSRALVIINTETDRTRAAHWLTRAMPGTRVEFKAPKRTLPQNDRFWSMLTDLATQLRWHGQRLSADDWKDVMMAGLRKEVRVVPNMDGNGFVILGRSSSDLSKQEFGDLMTLIEAFGAQQGVSFKVHEVRHDERGQEIAA